MIDMSSEIISTINLSEQNLKLILDDIEKLILDTKIMIEENIKKIERFEREMKND
jgi:PIN domain nuclease of toxin-antitoxin system